MSHIDPLDSSLLLLLQVGWLRINEKTGYMSPVEVLMVNYSPRGGLIEAALLQSRREELTCRSQEQT